MVTYWSWWLVPCNRARTLYVVIWKVIYFITSSCNSDSSSSSSSSKSSNWPKNRIVSSSSYINNSRLIIIIIVITIVILRPSLGKLHSFVKTWRDEYLLLADCQYQTLDINTGCMERGKETNWRSFAFCLWIQLYVFNSMRIVHFVS